MRLCFWLHSINDCLKKNHELAKWAKDNGYQGIKYFGARGNGQTYKNVAIFEEYVNTGIPTSGVPEQW